MLIKNAKLRNNDKLVDILIKDGIITKIDSNIEVSNDEIIDAKGFLDSFTDRLIRFTSKI